MAENAAKVNETVKEGKKKNVTNAVEMNSTQSVKANSSKDKNQTQNSNSSSATVSNSTKSQEFQPQLQTYQKLQEVER